MSRWLSGLHASTHDSNIQYISIVQL
jgi:hypothetical protein